MARPKPTYKARHPSREAGWCPVPDISCVLAGVQKEDDEALSKHLQNFLRFYCGIYQAIGNDPAQSDVKETLRRIKRGNESINYDYMDDHSMALLESYGNASEALRALNDGKEGSNGRPSRKEIHQMLINGLAHIYKEYIDVPTTTLNGGFHKFVKSVFASIHATCRMPVPSNIHKMILVAVKQSL